MKYSKILLSYFWAACKVLFSWLFNFIKLICFKTKYLFGFLGIFSKKLLSYFWASCKVLFSVSFDFLIFFSSNYPFWLLGVIFDFKKCSTILLFYFWAACKVLCSWSFDFLVNFEFFKHLVKFYFLGNLICLSVFFCQIQLFWLF